MQRFDTLLALFISFFSFVFIPPLSCKDTIYNLTNDPIDVVIPTAQKDLKLLEKCINGIKKNCANIGRVIVVSDKRYTNNAEWFDESLYPFSKYDVGYYLCQCNKLKTIKYIKNKKSRLGWYYQQLLKLYAPYVIPNLSPNMLVLDSDTVFLNPTEFTNSLNGGLFNVSREYHRSYFDHIDKLTKGQVKKIYKEHSGITHHMLFQKPILDELFYLVEKIHQKDFWKAFCLSVKNICHSGASEYELYFNFALSRTKQVEIRKLQWKNTILIDLEKNLSKQYYHYISYHNYFE